MSMKELFRLIIQTPIIWLAPRIFSQKSTFPQRTFILSTLLFSMISKNSPIPMKSSSYTSLHRRTPLVSPFSTSSSSAWVPTVTPPRSSPTTISSQRKTDGLPISMTHPSPHPSASLSPIRSSTTPPESHSSLRARKRQTPSSLSWITQNKASLLPESNPSSLANCIGSSTTPLHPKSIIPERLSSSDKMISYIYSFRMQFRHAYLVTYSLQRAQFIQSFCQIFLPGRRLCSN